MTDHSQISAAVPTPAHVPASHVYDIDLFRDPGIRDRGHDRIAEIVREAPPVFWTPRNGGHWVIRGFRAVHEASRDYSRFTSEFMPYEQLQAMIASLPPGAPSILLPVPITLDPPVHTRFRGPLNRAFSPMAVLGMKDAIRKLAVDLIEGVAERGSCEFVAEIAEPFPVTLFLRILGLPEERLREYRTVAQEHLASVSNPEPEGGQERLRHLVSVMSETIEARRTQPRDDLLSVLWGLEIDGRPMTTNDIENFSVVLFIGGLDTVVNGLGHAVRHLALNPELQERLRADPAGIARASEEMLRRYTFTVPPRKVARDIEFEGAPMKQGERVMLFLPAADLDPVKFDEPEVYSPDRESNAHIAFGAGPHRCVGMHLARMELQVFYEEFLKRIPSFRLDAAQTVQYHSGHVIGPDSINLVWDPTERNRA